jgi:hypothetical protein
MCVDGRAQAVWRRRCSAGQQPRGQGRQLDFSRSSKVESAERAMWSSSSPGSMPLTENSMTALDQGLECAPSAGQADC